MTDKPYLTVAETADLLQLSRQSIYRAIDRGEIEVLKVGSAKRIPRAEIDKLVLRNRVAS